MLANINLILINQTAPASSFRMTIHLPDCISSYKCQQQVLKNQLTTLLPYIYYPSIIMQPFPLCRDLIN